MKPVHRHTLALLVLVGLAIALLPEKVTPPPPPTPASVGEPLLDPELQRAHGTRPGATTLPATAVDTSELPNIVLSAADPADSPLPYYEVAPGTYLLFGNVAITDPYNRGWNGNAGFVVSEQGVVVIDSLGTPKLGARLIATVRRVTDRPITHLVITHNHPDHSYGAAAFRRLEGVTIIAHQGTLDYIGSEQAESSAAYRRELLGEDMAGFEWVTPDRPVGGERFDALRIESGGRRFDIYNAGRHHSFGDLVVHQVDDGILWISDLAFNQRTTFMGDGHSQQVLEAQDWLARSFPRAKLMIPGHGSAQTPPFPMLARTHDYVQRLREALTRAIDDDLSLDEAVDAADFPDWRNVRLYAINHRANANFVYRELEDELF